MVYIGATNTLNCRIILSIALWESNEDGGFFISLYTAKYIHSDNWVELPIEKDVVKRVEELAKIEKQPAFDQYQMFEWSPRIPIMDNMTSNEDK